MRPAANLTAIFHFLSRIDAIEDEAAPESDPIERDEEPPTEREPRGRQGRKIS
jgi:hypothetical protein